MKIIDIHTHPEHLNRDGEKLSLEESIALLLTPMDDFGVRMSGLLGYNVMPFQNEASVRRVNDLTAAMVAARPDRFLGFAFINPLCSPAFVAEELDRCLRTPEFSGVKLEIDLNCRNPRLDAVMEKAIQYDVPVLHHAWYVNLWALRPEELALQNDRSEPHDIANLARRFPEAKIIMAHLEGCGIRGILDVADLENIWIDTSGAQPFTGTLEFALREIGSSRILFGSDMLGRGLASQLGRVQGAGLTEEEFDRITFGNAEALFHLGAGANSDQI